MTSSTERPIPLRVRDDLISKWIHYKGLGYWVIKDPVSLKYTRLHPEQFYILNLLNGERNPDEIKDEVHRQYPTLLLSISEIQQLISDLYRKGLLTSGRPGQGVTLIKQRREEHKKKLVTTFRNLMYLRLPGWDPETTLQWLYPYVKWMWRPWATTMFVLLIVSSWILIGVQFEAFRSRLPEFQQFFGWPNLIYMWFVLGAAKVIHEFGHGLMGFVIPLVGLIYLAIGAGVWWLKSDRRESWTLLLYCSVTAALLFLAGPSLPPAWMMSGINIPLVGATAFHLFTTYPLEPAWSVRFPWVRAAVYGTAFALAALVPLQPWLGDAGSLVAPLLTAYSVAMATACMAIAIVERLRHRGSAAAERASIMILGGMASFVPVVALLAWHVTRGTSFPWTISLVGFFVFPAAVAYGIIRSDLFDLRRVAKSSAAYGAVTLAITGLFAFLVTFADAVVRWVRVDARSPLFSVAFLFLAILLFNPLRNRVQRLVDRFFDRERAAYRRAVREISEAMVAMLSVKEIVDRILIAVTDTMGVEGAAVLLLDDEEGRLRAEAARGEWEEDEALRLELAADHPVCRSLWMRRTELAREDFDDEPDPELREACRDVFDGLGAELLVPVLFGVDLLGIIAVGRKLTGERLGPDERQLLRTLANQSAIAIENAKAFDEIAKLNETLEARVEERTHELRETQAQLVQSEKMRSLGQLVAGVAHELNNPIGFTHANLQLLEEYVNRLLDPGLDEAKRQKTREAIGKLLARSREGTERVKQIVQDLRTFSRTDQAELQEVDLNAEIDRTLSLMEPRLKGGVELLRDYRELPRVRCYAGQLNQVFMNILMNACDAMEGHGRIEIRTRPEGDGVRLEFEDDGPGMTEQVRQRIFEPFFTTKPVGQGTGLGLSLSHGIVERHGGTMEVWSEPGRGTRFTIRLPREAPQAAGRAEEDARETPLRPGEEGAA